MTAANVAFDDHPNEKRFSDQIETVTVDSVFAWMPRAGLTRQPVATLHRDFSLVAARRPAQACVSYKRHQKAISTSRSLQIIMLFNQGVQHERSAQSYFCFFPHILAQGVTSSTRFATR
jgi:hypothetical protein